MSWCRECRVTVCSERVGDSPLCSRMGCEKGLYGGGSGLRDAGAGLALGVGLNQRSVDLRDIFPESVSGEAPRVFATGATRNNDPERIDWVKMLSLPALLEFGRHMRKHRKQADGSLRGYDNWKGADGKGGFPRHEIVESLFRHVLDLVALDQGVEPIRDAEIRETCCAILANAMFYLHEEICGSGLGDVTGKVGVPEK